MGQVRKRTRWIRSGPLRIDQTAPGATYVLYFDGNSGWEILPHADLAERRLGKTTVEVIDLDGDELLVPGRPWPAKVDIRPFRR
jgi:hypothetical protein